MRRYYTYSPGPLTRVRGPKSEERGKKSERLRLPERSSLFALRSSALGPPCPARLGRFDLAGDQRGVSLPAGGGQVDPVVQEKLGVAGAGVAPIEQRGVLVAL